MVRGIENYIGSNVVRDILQASQKGEKDTLEQATPSVPSAPAPRPASVQSASSANMMSQNFASAGRTESKYVKATIAGFRASQKVNDQQKSTLNSILQTAQIECQNAGSLGETYKALRRAAKNIAGHQSDEVRKTAEETHLKETREAIEKKAQEALAPTDANGNPIVGLPGESPAETAPMPEITSSSPTPEMEPTQASQASVALSPKVAAALQAFVHTPTATPSLDIQV